MLVGLGEPRRYSGAVGSDLLTVRVFSVPGGLREVIHAEEGALHEVNGAERVFLIANQLLSGSLRTLERRSLDRTHREASSMVSGDRAEVCSAIGAHQLNSRLKG